MNKISASSISAFRKCSTAYRLAYIEGLRPAIEADTLRVGSSWHGALEAYEKATGDKMTAAVEYLNERYAQVPAHKTAAEYGLEYITLLTCLSGYLWYWSEDTIEVLATELPFDLPLHLPRTGLPLPTSEVVRTGKIDALVRWQGKVGVLERKTTSRSIDADSDYWDRWRKDLQISNYCLALHDMAEGGLLPANVPADAQRANVIVDIFRKPTIAPKMLTQADTRLFAETGEYMGEKFVAVASVDNAEQPTLTVDGVHAEIEMGKRGYAIRETLRMFAARLLVDIQEGPAKYFARREIARTDAELKKFRHDLFVTYQSMKLHESHNLWVENEASCDVPYRCQFKPICYGAGSEVCCDRKAPVPAGFTRLAWVDLTISAKSEEE